MLMQVQAGARRGESHWIASQAGHANHFSSGGSFRTCSGRPEGRITVEYAVFWL